MNLFSLQVEKQPSCRAALAGCRGARSGFRSRGAEDYAVADPVVAIPGARGEGVVERTHLLLEHLSLNGLDRGLTIFKSQKIMTHL